jgi:hypothetical protein
VTRDTASTLRVTRSGRIVKGYTNEADAARDAFDRSAKGKQPESLGGDTSYKGFDEYLKARGFDPDQPTGPYPTRWETPASERDLEAEVQRLYDEEERANASGDKYEQRAASVLRGRRQNFERKLAQLRGGVKPVGKEDLILPPDPEPPGPRPGSIKRENVPIQRGVIGLSMEERFGKPDLHESPPGVMGDTYQAQRKEDGSYSVSSTTGAGPGPDLHAHRGRGGPGRGQGPRPEARGGGRRLDQGRGSGAAQRALPAPPRGPRRHDPAEQGPRRGPRPGLYAIRGYGGSVSWVPAQRGRRSSPIRTPSPSRRRG